jgi:threonine/homoserine/homoserine lactone efflux protein
MTFLTETFLPDTATLLAYTAACFVLFITPGPDMSLFLAKTIAGGRKAGIAAMLGACSGCCVHTILAALGVSALIAASPLAFTALKIGGALYLAWLAVQAVRHGSSLNIKSEASGTLPFWPTFATGVGINLSNPKVILFFVTFFPQFVDAADPHATGKLIFLGVYFVLFSIPLATLMILGAEQMIGTLRRSPGVMRAIDYAFAGIFGAFAVTILRAQAK